MGAPLTFDETKIRTDATGVEHVAVVCWKCGGTGHLPGYEFSDGGRCWGCMGHVGPIGWRTREEFSRIMARREKDAERRARKAREAAEAQREAFANWCADHSDVVLALAEYAGHSSFVLDLAARVEEGTALTDAQVEAVRKAIDAEQERDANEVDVPEGRQEIEGEIVSVKEVADTFSYTERYITKILVDCGGFRVYGTAPRGLDVVERGARVAFTATLEPKEKGFGFYKRPTKPRSLSAA